MKPVAVILFLFAAFCCNALEKGKITDMGAAKEWCDDTMLEKIEGIWEFPDDQTRVLLRRSANQASNYDIVVVESPDTRLKAGETIGYLKKSAADDKFEMLLYRNKKNSGILDEPGKCLAQYSEKYDALLVKGRSVKFSLGSRYLLPAFWRIVRISVKNPLDELPRGMVRLYPKTKRSQPDYL